MSVRRRDSDKDSINLLKETPACNPKAIRRASKDIKDPNPLTSTTKMIAKKCPISIDKRKAIKFQIPKQFTCNTSDNHNISRVLCKKEAVDWWVIHAPFLSPEQIQVIDALYDLHRREAQSYFCVNWKEGTIRFAPELETKQVVNARNSIAKIQKSI